MVDLPAPFGPIIARSSPLSMLNDKLSIALNVNNLLNVLPEWAFKADNAAGQAIIDDTSIISIADGGSGLTQLRMKLMPLLLMVVTLK